MKRSNALGLAMFAGAAVSAFMPQTEQANARSGAILMNRANILRRLFLFGIASRKLLVAAAGLAMGAGVTPAAAQSDACKQGYVWREALANDHVCVTPDTRRQAATDNAAAAQRRSPGAGDSCITGYVWREANAQDHVCVTEQTRRQVIKDNAEVASRVASAPIVPPLAQSGGAPISTGTPIHIRLAGKAMTLAELERNLMRDRAQHRFYTPLAMRLPEPVGIFAPVPPGLKPPITIAMLPGKNDPRQPINPPDVSRRLFNTTPPPLTPRTERETQNGVSNPIDGYIYCLGHVNLMVPKGNPTGTPDRSAMLPAFSA